MKIEIKNVQYSAFASHDSHCFEATVYVDGKRAFTASDQGMGGCIDFYAFNDGSPKETRELVDSINKELSTTFCKEFPDLPMCLEIVIGELVNDFLVMKDLKKSLKKLCYLNEENKICELAAKHKPTEKNQTDIKNCSWWNDSNILLNELPIDEALKAFRSAANF